MTEIVDTKKVKIEKYLCSWEDLLEQYEDMKNLLTFLNDGFDIKLKIDETKIVKIDDNTIRIKKEIDESFIAELRINKEKELVILKIDNKDKEYTFSAKEENGKFNILDRIAQGDIYKDVEFIESIDVEKMLEKDVIIEVNMIIFPYIIILSQDCDLAQDFKFRNERKNGDKIILSALVAPIYNADQVFEGSHLDKIRKELPMQTINKYKKGKLTTDAKNLYRNDTPRYHYLEFSSDIQMSPSIIDFKHYFSLNLEYLYKIRRKNFVCKISELYREDISQRFASFLSRIPV